MAMPCVLTRLFVPLTVVVLILGGAGLARASLDELAVAQSLASSPAPLLGPINSLGRTGWDCHPEKAARTARLAEAELPDDASR
jgi:hypothetical protein